MDISYRKIVKNYIEYNSKPFISKNIADETGIDLLRVKKVIAFLLDKRAIKVISRDGKYKIYIKDSKFKEEPATNEFGYNYRMMRKIFNLLKRNKISSCRVISEKTGYNRNAILRYLTAFASAKAITLELGYYKVLINDPDYTKIGKKVEDGILTKLREEDTNDIDYSANVTDPQLVKRDAVVNRVMKRAFRLHTKIMDEKERLINDINKYLSQTADPNDDDRKKNLELFSFNGNYKIEIQHLENTEFSEKQQIASTKQYITFYERPASDKPFKQISLDFCAI